jgi:hypothetical protein
MAGQNLAPAPRRAHQASRPRVPLATTGPARAEHLLRELAFVLRAVERVRQDMGQVGRAGAYPR